MPVTIIRHSDGTRTVVETNDIESRIFDVMYNGSLEERDTRGVGAIGPDAAHKEEVANWRRPDDPEPPEDFQDYDSYDGIPWNPADVGEVPDEGEDWGAQGGEEGGGAQGGEEGGGAQGGEEGGGALGGGEGGGGLGGGEEGGEGGGREGGSPQ